VCLFWPEQALPFATDDNIEDMRLINRHYNMNKVLLIVSLTRFHHTGWKPVVRGFLKFDFEKNPLELKMIFEDGVEESQKINFYDANGDDAGGFDIVVNTDKSFGYKIRECQNEDSKFTTQPTWAKEMIWRITKKKAGADDVTLLIHANDKEVASFKIGTPVCKKDTDYSEAWNRVATQIEIHTKSRDSDDPKLAKEYRAYVAPGDLIGDRGWKFSDIFNYCTSKRDSCFYSLTLTIFRLSDCFF
jgi:hypothetical protein